MSSLIVEVCKIDEVNVHPNADRLELAKVKGWQTIIVKGQYKPGDLVVFIPPDSILPKNLIDQYEITYLKNNNGRTGTVKLRGYLSEGLVLPVAPNFSIGENVAEKMGITKWEPEEPKSQSMKANPTSKRKLNPYFDRYTDIENIKNFNDVFEDGEMVVVTLKIHGGNARYSRLPIPKAGYKTFLEQAKSWFKINILRQTQEYVYGSHNVQLRSEKSKTYYGKNIWFEIGKQYNFEKWLPDNTIVYGEIYGKHNGSNVQDLTYGLDHLEFAVFDIKQDGKYLNWFDVKEFCEDYGLKTVPELYIGPYSEDVVKRHTDGKDPICPTQIREGCVIKPIEENFNPKIGRKILKSVSTDYLTRKNATEFH